MGEKRTIGRIVARLALAGAAIGFLATTTVQAGGYYGGYSHYGYGYAPYGHGYGYRPYYYGGYAPYGHGYGYSPYYYGGYAPYGHGYVYAPYYDGGSSRYRDDTTAPASGSDSASRGGGGSADHPYDGNSGADTDAMGGEGWNQLATGRYGPALRDFARQAEGHPRQGLPKVGYALSAALGGDLARGVWAMRRALRIDPNAVNYVVIGDTLRPKIEDLIGRYGSRPDGAKADGGAAFMRSSLHYLMGDTTSARHQIDLAATAGDRRPSTVNLRRLIAEDPGDTETEKARPPPGRGSSALPSTPR